MKRYVVIEKKSGETPLMALTTWKTAHLEYNDVPASYAGRLDPMASGKLLVLLGEECKRQDEYKGLDKEYEIEVLLDIGSDTGDALGLATYSGKETRVDEGTLSRVLRSERRRHIRAYPRFSSRPVNGKPLFLHALEGTIDTIQIPEHEERIYSIDLLGIKYLQSAELHARIEDFLSRVPKSDDPGKALGRDFRINDVRAKWNEIFAELLQREFSVLTLRVSCGSGTYMRSLAGRIGSALGTNALALSIYRTKIGKRFGPFWLTSF